MESKKLIFLVGKTSSGKDTVAKYISDKYGIPMVCSYTTRGMRDYEEDGVQHYFISKERMKEILNTESIVAYVKFPKTEIEYCATLESIKSGVAVYIIDPNGVEWLKTNGCVKDTEFFSVYVDLSEDEIIKRAKDRGDKVSDIEARLNSERDIFDNFKASKGYDYLIDNSGSYEDLIKQVDEIMRESL